jgi:hypothetical protein
MVLISLEPWTMEIWAWLSIGWSLFHIHGMKAHGMGMAPGTLVHRGWRVFPLEAPWHHWTMRLNPSFTWTWPLEAYEITLYPLTSTWRIGFDGWCGFEGYLT